MNGLDIIKARAFGAGGGDSGGSGGGSELLDSLIDGSIAGELESNVEKVKSYNFYECQNLLSIVLPNASFVGRNAFYACTNLKIADLTVVSNLLTETFNLCEGLSAVILRKTDKICTMNTTTAFSNSSIKSGSGYIYVPSALVDTYKAATNWSTYAAQFRALEDYTVDGTTTGALDPEKIGA